MWRMSVLWVCISRRRGLGLRRGEIVESCLVGGEICFGPWFRSLPAGLGRLKPGESYPAKTLCRQISAATAGKTQPFCLPAIRGDADHPRKCCAPLDGLSRHGDHMHVEQWIEVEDYNPGRLQLKIRSALRLPAASVQHAADRVVSFCQPLPLRTLRLDRTWPENSGEDNDLTLPINGGHLTWRGWVSPRFVRKT